MTNRLITPERVAVGIGVLVTALGSTGCAATVDRYTYKPLEGHRLAVCDGATVRDAPHTGGSIVLEIDFGNAPKDTCIDTEIGKVSVASGYDFNGAWFCAPEQEFAGAFTGTGFSNESERMLCINGARAHATEN